MCFRNSSDAGWTSNSIPHSCLDKQSRPYGEKKSDNLIKKKVNKQNGGVKNKT